MININMYEINETYNITEHEKLDMRVITPGVSLLDYVDSDLEALSEKICKKIMTLTKDLVSTDRDIEADFGILIVNKRTSVTSITLVGGSACRRPEDFVTITKILDLAAKEVGVNFIGGYSALVSRNMTRTDKNLILSISQVLSQTKRVRNSADVGSARTGIDMDAAELMGRIMTETAEATRDHNSLGYAKLVVFCGAPDDNSFMAGTFHGVIESEAIINIDVSDPGVMKAALARARDANLEVLYETIKKTVFKITHVGQLVAQEVSKHMGIPFGIIDLSLAPIPSVGNSVAEILEEIGLERVGAPGTTAAFAIPNDQVEKGGVMASSYVGGLSGAFIPVGEDQGMIDVISMRAPTTGKLETMTCVYFVSLDMVAIPGDIPSSAVTGIIVDEAVIGMVNQKTTVVRLISVVGKKVGETAEFGGSFGHALITPVNTLSYRRFIIRDRGIPALIRSFKN